MEKTAAEKLHIPEILAPSGTEDALKAAVSAGCDAIYLGGNMFSARAFAGNFSEEELLRSLDYCHLFDIKIYMTVNTLLKEQEIGRLTDYMEPYYKAGLDGVIIQDVGVAKVLREAFPGLHLHASTQMSISSSYGARLLKNQGFTRIVPSRELSLEEIKSIKQKADIEIETFVHGAMCFAYSGKCLFSSFMGGRSGNRGRCAQPCRQCYETGRTKEYMMSMKDMCTLSILPELIDAGIDSFKIEGRMKNPYYVAATVDAYRTARDTYLGLLKEKGKCAWKELGNAQQKYLDTASDLTEKMQDIYNRGGFSSGYYFMEKGPEMIASERPNHTGIKVGTVAKVQGPEVTVRLEREVFKQDVLEIRGPDIELTAASGLPSGNDLKLKGKEIKKIKPGMPVYRTRNNHLLEEIENSIINIERKIPVKVTIYAETGKALMITISDPDGQISVTVKGKTAEAASSSPTTAEQLLSKMKKTAGTGIEPEITCIMDDNVFVPMSEFNDLRRKAVEMFRQEKSGQYHRT